MPSPMFWMRCWRVGERRHPDPLRALAAHLREPTSVAVPSRGCMQHHGVAADPAPTTRRPAPWSSVLCGQPEQKYGVRAAGARAARSARRARLGERAAPTRSSPRGQPRRDARRDHVGVELAVRGEQRRAVVVALAERRAGRSARAVEDSLTSSSTNGALLLDDDDLLAARARTRARSRARADRACATLSSRTPAALERRVVEPECRAAPARRSRYVLPAATSPSRSPGRADASIALSRSRARRRGPSSRRALVDLALERRARRTRAAARRRRARRRPPASTVGRTGDAAGATSTVPDAVGDRGGDLDRRPQARGARERDRVEAEVEHLLRVGRATAIGTSRSAERRSRTTLGSVEDLQLRVVADEAAPRRRARAAPVRLACRIASRGAVEARRLAVPEADHAVEARARAACRRAGCP